MSTIPTANHPSTPTEMMVSSVTRDSEGLEFGFESGSAGFMAIDDSPRDHEDGRREYSKVYALGRLSGRRSPDAEA